MSNTRLDEYIESLKEGSIIDYYGHDYEIVKCDSHNVTLQPAWACTEEEREEETMNVTWGDIADQTLESNL